MGEPHLAGVLVEEIVDDHGATLAFRSRVLDRQEAALCACSAERFQRLASQVEMEKEVDPQGDAWYTAAWNWSSYFEWVRRPTTFGTYYNICSYAAMSGRSVHGYQEMQGEYVRVCKVDGSGENPGLLRLLRSGIRGAY